MQLYYDVPWQVKVMGHQMPDSHNNFTIETFSWHFHPLSK